MSVVIYSIVQINSHSDKMIHLFTELQLFFYKKKDVTGKLCDMNNWIYELPLLFQAAWIGPKFNAISQLFIMIPFALSCSLLPIEA